MEGTIAEIRMFAGNFAPRSWAFCNGQLLSIAQYTAVFALLGTTFGGNGQTTFALPDLRGRVALGTGQGPGLPSVNLGEMAGSPQVTLTIANMPAHNHQVTGQLPLSAAGDGTLSTDAANRYLGPTGIYSSSGDDLQNMRPINVNMPTNIAGSNAPVTTMPPYLGMNFIVCLEGIFPSRN
ncbi:MAG: phage tail protein [Chitinophagaceae bacterium]|nr:phage tail protein [Chitinophagaceae bacterium]MBK8952691.1 phage tail protein [Chitinophagaceae bacterium]